MAPQQQVIASYNTWQWEQMQKFHSSIQQWPATVQPNSTWTAGGSPLVWTMLYPPLDIAWLQTYTWAGHLDNFMPWTTSNLDCDTWPPLILHAIQSGKYSTFHVAYPLVQTSYEFLRTNPSFFPNDHGGLGGER